MKMDTLPTTVWQRNQIALVILDSGNLNLYKVSVISLFQHLQALYNFIAGSGVQGNACH